MRAQLIASASAAVLAIAAPGCSENIECGEGTFQKGALCLPLPLEEAPDAGAPEDAGPPACDPACGPGFYCSDGTCLRGEVPLAWRCRDAAFADGANCDCACGLVDPDCANEALPVQNCLSGDCNPDGTCAPCVPSCGGKSCGSDGCGGLCGTCTDPAKLNCIDGTCQACAPSCAGKGCGSDGCGGSCGTCDVGAQCNLGACAFPPSGASCLGICGYVAESGCSCTAGCASAGGCCADVARCGCIPACVGKECGGDGCGGSCGDCGSDDKCEDGRCVEDLCAPDPCNGHGACAPATGACTCDAAHSGPSCNACAQGYFRYPDCLRDICDLESITCSGHGQCNPLDGECACNGGFAGTACDSCQPGHGTYPSCTP